MLGKVNFPIQEVDQLTIVVCHHKLTYTQYMYHIIDPIQESGDGRFSWLNAHPSYSCVVASPKKEAKFKGLKSYIAYQLTPSVSIHFHSLIVWLFSFSSSITFKCHGGTSTLTGSMSNSRRSSTLSQSHHCLTNRFKVSWTLFLLCQSWYHFYWPNVFYLSHDAPLSQDMSLSLGGKF